MEELFSARCLFADKGKQLISYVLLTGEAGTGKSTSVRKLAYIWAKVAVLRNVTLVYFILVRNLQASRYNGQDDCFHAETLATAVVWECIPWARGEQNKFLWARKLVE